MLQSFFILATKTSKVIAAREFIKNGIDEDTISSFLNTMSGVVETTFTGKTTQISEISMKYGDQFLFYRFGQHICGVIVSGIESKRFETTLSQTVFEIEERLSEELKQEVIGEEVVPRITDVVLKNFRELIFEEVADIGDVKTLLGHKTKYFFHTGEKGAKIYISKKNSAAFRIFIHSYDTITKEGVDEVIAILRTDLVTLETLEDRIRLLSEQDLALTLRQLLRLNIIDCYSQPEES